MKQIILLSILFFVAVPRPAAQYNTNQNKKWVFGKYAGLDFVSGLPVPFTTTINTNEGVATVSDASGNLLFYTNGTDIFNRLGTIMPTGTSVVPTGWGTNSTSQAALIVPVMGNPNRYYVFSMGSIVVAPSYCPLAYCIVDMTLDGGLGDVIPTTIGTPVNNLLGEKMAAVAGNNCNLWLVVHRRDSAKFFAYEITGAGISLTPVISTSGTLLSSPATSLGAYAQGVLRFSPNRQKLVVQASNGQTTEIHDFNPTTGIVSNCRTIATPGRNQYGADFSPDNSKLYTQQVNSAPASSSITQYDVTLPTAAAIIASAYTVTNIPTSLVYSELQLGPDGRIYLANLGGGTGSLDRINNPNLAGAACGFTPNALALAAGTQVFLGLHNVVVTVLPADTTYTHHDTTLCIPPGGTTIWPHGTGTSYSWYDGATTPTHNITSPGVYWVAIINGCTVRYDTINVINLPGPPPPVISGDTVYCYGDTFVPFTVIGTGILWYASATSTTGSPIAPVVNTNIPGVYTFYATQTIGCESPKASITVTVLPGIVPSFSWVIRPGCVSDTIEFTNTTAGVNTYSWNFGDGSPADTSSLHITHIFSPHGVYSITLTTYSANGCTGDTTIAIDTHSIGAGFTILPDTLCAGSAAAFTMTSPPSAIAKYLWNFGNGDTTGTTPAPIHTYSVAGIFPVTLTITDTMGCVDSLTKNVYVIGLRINTFHDTTLCVSRRLKLYNDIILLPGGISDDFVFHWTPAQHLNDTSAQMPEYTGIGLTTYTFTVTVKPYGCMAMDTVRVHGVPGKPLTHVSNDTTIQLGESVQLNSWNEIFYRWTPNDGSLSNPNINNPIATPVLSTLYTVFGYDGDGCLDSAFVMIYVDSSMDECIPSGFTPNADGLNDVFRPLCLRHQKVIEFNIYNRWGQLVFHTTSADKGWDGTYMGIPQELGVYFYMITIARPDRHNIIYKGDLTLIR